jgi:hypothetical protein
VTIVKRILIYVWLRPWSKNGRMGIGVKKTNGGRVAKWPSPLQHILYCPLEKPEKTQMERPIDAERLTIIIDLCNIFIVK